MQLPSVSVVFLSYKQERFVGEALRGALAQDLDDYELIVADDASPDGTWDVIQEVLAEPKHAGVRVKSFRQPKNLGIIENFNTALGMASGEVIVLMAGDDVSYPGRARLTARAFAADSSLRVVNCAWRDVDASGATLPHSLPDLRTRTFAHDSGRHDPFAGSPVIGACAAYHRSLWDVFGPLSPDAGGEDVDFLFRGLLLGSVHYLGTVLVDYRQHDGNLYNFNPSVASLAELERREIRSTEARAGFERQWRRDLLRAQKLGLVDADRFRETELIVARYSAQHRLDLLSLKVATLPDWWRAAWSLLRLGEVRRFRKSFMLRFFKSRRLAYFKRRAGCAC